MRLIYFVLSVVLVLGLMAPAAFAGGGAPAKHGVSGKDFGSAVSDLAKSGPGAVADHVSSSGGGNGIPAKHGVSGKDFGSAVSDLAKSGPGAVADHVSGD